MKISWNPKMPPAEREAARKRWQEHRKELEKQRLTEEEKMRWAAMMQETWQQIAADAEASFGETGGRMTNSLVVEMVCDANRLQQFGGMTDHEDAFLGVVYHRPSFQKWARQVLNYY